MSPAEPLELAPQRRAARWLSWAVTAALGVVAGLYVKHGYVVVWLWRRQILPDSPEGWLELAHPGHWQTAQWLREHGITRLYTLPYETGNGQGQRITEVLYPIELVPADPATLAAGDIAVLPADRAPGRAAETMFAAGQLVVVRIR